MQRSPQGSTARIFWIVIIVILTGATLWYAWHAQYNHDEIEHLHASWLIAQGMRPFADFLEQHHPALWYALAPLTSMFTLPHGLIFLVRVLDVAGGGLVLLITHRIMRLLFPSTDARWSVLLLASSYTFANNSLLIRPDPWMNLFVYAGLLFWVRHLLSGRRADALIAGLLWGLAIVVLQKAVPFVALVVCGSMLLVVLRRQDRRERRALTGGIAWLLAAAAVPVLVMCAWIRAAGLWDAFFFWNYTFNRYFYLEAVLKEHFSFLVTLRDTLRHDPVLCIAGTFGAVAIVGGSLPSLRARSSRGPREDARLLVVLVALGYLVFFARNRFPFEQYLIIWLPLLAVASVKVFDGASRRALALLRPACMAMAVELVIVYQGWPSNAAQREIHALLLRDTAPGETLFAPPPYNPVFRRDAAFFWYNGLMIGQTYADFCKASGTDDRYLRLDVERWTSAPPRVVYYDRTNPSHNAYLWEEQRSAYTTGANVGVYWRKSARQGMLEEE